MNDIAKLEFILLVPLCLTREHRDLLASSVESARWAVNAERDPVKLSHIEGMMRCPAMGHSLSAPGYISQHAQRPTARRTQGPYDRWSAGTKRIIVAMLQLALNQGPAGCCVGALQRHPVVRGLGTAAPRRARARQFTRLHRQPLLASPTRSSVLPPAQTARPAPEAPVPVHGPLSSVARCIWSPCVVYKCGAIFSL